MLADVLLDAGRAEDAEALYKEDLEIYPENGWSLYGLSRSLRAQGRADEAAEIVDRFKTAWANADVTLG